MSKKHDRKCPCGSGKLFKDCCSIVTQGQTPDYIKVKITNVIIETFDVIGDTRGELCLYVSYLVKDLLKLYNYRSYVVAGAAKWNNYSSYYQWKPNDPIPQFHAWAVTEFGEIVDLACDSFETRYDAYTSLSVRMGRPSPSMCWDKNPSDRHYELRDLGAKSINIDKRAYEKIKKVAFDIHSTI